MTTQTKRQGQSSLTGPVQVRLQLSGWECVERGADGSAWRSRDALHVIESSAIEQDGRRWQHVSLSRSEHMPTYDDLTRVKALFVGEDREAYMVLPPKVRHVNIHPFCLHLFSCMDAAPDGAILPDFTCGSGHL